MSHSSPQPIDPDLGSCTVPSVLLGKTASAQRGALLIAAAATRRSDQSGIMYKMNVVDPGAFDRWPRNTRYHFQH
jgi:hypothetical protein